MQPWASLPLVPSHNKEPAFQGHKTKQNCGARSALIASRRTISRGFPAESPGRLLLNHPGLCPGRGFRVANTVLSAHTGPTGGQSHIFVSIFFHLLMIEQFSITLSIRLGNYHLIKFDSQLFNKLPLKPSFQRQPVSLPGAISAWNYYLTMAFVRLGTALDTADDDGKVGISGSSPPRGL